MELSKSQEEYVKAIYILQNMNEQVRVTDIANKLSISKPSVTRSIKNLSELNILNYQTYGNVSLTSLGESIAKEIIKKQDTLKNFLCEILDIEESMAEDEAVLLKHDLSAGTIKKIDELVNKILDLGNSSCNCNENSEKCQKCIKYTIKNRLNARRKKC